MPFRAPLLPARRRPPPCDAPISRSPGAHARRPSAVRRGLLAASLADAAARAAAAVAETPRTRVTLGDSILDCGRRNARGTTPGALLVRNDDGLFPAFRGRDLTSRTPTRLDHRATDGSMLASLPAQARGLQAKDGDLAILTVGGNELPRGLAADRGASVAAFARELDAFVRALPLRPVVLGTVHDPSFGDDARNPTAVDPRVARSNLAADDAAVDAAIAEVAARHGRLADLHAHFLAGHPSWIANGIEPSLEGASEVRRVFLDALDR